MQYLRASGQVSRDNLALVQQRILQVFHDSYRELRPRAPIPELSVEFYPFASLNNNIRLREGKLRVRLSDVLEGAPEPVLQAIAHILLAKMYRREIRPMHSARFRRYVSSRDIAHKAQVLRQLRGRKRVGCAQGDTYDLEVIFEKLNTTFFHGLLARPRIAWSRHRSRRRLGHYDASHNTIVVSKIFDDPRISPDAVEYIVYHEMLHLKHPVKLRGTRRCIHSNEFQAEEKNFPALEKMKALLKSL